MGPREEWLQWFRDSGLSPPPVAVETRSVDAMRALIARSGFLGWMPRLLIEPLASDDMLIAQLPVEGAIFFRHFAIYGRRQGILSPSSIKLLEELRRSVSNLRNTHSQELE
jgi:DNA-binding transcriptional LysR family regulator